MKHLVKVTAKFEFVILVDDAETALEICEQFAQDALQDMSPSDVLYRTEPYNDGCIGGWDGSIEPYNGAGKSTKEWSQLITESASSPCSISASS